LVPLLCLVLLHSPDCFPFMHLFGCEWGIAQSLCELLVVVVLCVPSQGGLTQ
jgi:hypothetical protein